MLGPLIPQFWTFDHGACVFNFISAWCYTGFTYTSRFRLWYRTARKRKGWFTSGQQTTTGLRYPAQSSTYTRCHPDVSRVTRLRYPAPSSTRTRCRADVSRITASDTLPHQVPTRLARATLTSVGPLGLDTLPKYLTLATNSPQKIQLCCGSKKITFSGIRSWNLWFDGLTL